MKYQVIQFWLPSFADIFQDFPLYKGPQLHNLVLNAQFICTLYSQKFCEFHRKNAKLYQNETHKMEVQTIHHIFEDFKVYELLFVLFQTQKINI